MTPARRSLLLPLSALLCATASAQGYDWDYPDGLGVRYQLYERMERTTFKPKSFPPEMRALFQPKSKADWVRIKGTQLAWGMRVYEFPADAGDDAFGKFLQERDPRRTFREFKIEGEPAKERQGRYWEFIDTWRPFLEVLDRPQPAGPFRYAVCPELSIRFLADKTMEYVDPFTGIDGDNCYARMHPAARLWLRIDGPPGPVGWMLRLHVFPEMKRERSGSDRDQLVASFASYADEHDSYRKTYRREITVRDQEGRGPGLPHRLWRWLDTRSDGKKDVTPCYHVVAAVYDIGGREVALVGMAPANDAKVPEVWSALEKMVASVETWSGKATEPGFAFYNLAASCKVGDRQVGIVVDLPYGADPKPDRKLFDIARRMVTSIEPKAGKN